MKYLVLLLVLTSCADIQKATNVNALADQSEHFDGLVKTLANEAEAANCKFISNVTASDNLMNLGKESAITTMKKHASEKDGDSIVLGECTETKTAISPINTCKGKIYKCR